MGIIKALRRGFGLEKSAPPPSAPWSARYLGLDYMGDAVTYRRAIDEAARNPVAAQCVAVISDAAYQVRPVFYREASADRVEVKAPEALAVLDGLSLPEALVHLLAAGNLYVRAVESESGRGLRRLDLLAPDEVTVTRLGVGLQYQWSPSSRAGVTWLVLPGDEAPAVVHVARPRMAGWRDVGYGALDAAARAVRLHNAAITWNEALLRNSARPSGFLSFGASRNGQAEAGYLSAEQVAALKAELRAAYESAANAGRPMVLDGGLSWQQLGLSPADMDWVLGKDSVAIDIATAFGVPAQLIGVRGAQTYANMTEARSLLWVHTILPRLDQIFQAINRYVMPRLAPGLVVDFDRDAIEALVDLRRQRASALADLASLLTVNERREALGYGARPDGDEIMVAATQIPLRAAVDPVDGDESA